MYEYFFCHEVSVWKSTHGSPQLSTFICRALLFPTPDILQSIPIYPTQGNLSILLVESDTAKAKSIL